LEWAKDDSKTNQLVPDDVVVNLHRCANKRCISVMENVDSLFRKAEGEDGVYRCVYCESKAK
jgi:aspartate carbamoyltransferase regulatory subunit